MADTYVLKIKTHRRKIDNADTPDMFYLGHDIIPFSERMSALRFIWEIYDITENAAGMRVDCEKKIALAVETDDFLYEIVGG